MSEVRPLSVRQAWALLAELWSAAKVCTCCPRYAVFDRCNGLCSSVSTLRFRGYITAVQEARMLASLPKWGKRHLPDVVPYLWPTDKAGAEARAVFCAEQANGG